MFVTCPSLFQKKLNSTRYNEPCKIRDHIVSTNCYILCVASLNDLSFTLFTSMIILLGADRPKPLLKFSKKDTEYVESDSAGKSPGKFKATFKALGEPGGPSSQRVINYHQLIHVIMYIDY